MSRAKEKQVVVTPLCLIHFILFFSNPKSSQFSLALPAFYLPVLSSFPFLPCSMLLALARFALSSSFIDHVYDMTGTLLSLFFSRLLKGQEMMGRGERKHLIALGLFERSKVTACASILQHMRIQSTNTQKRGAKTHESHCPVRICAAYWSILVLPLAGGLRMIVQCDPRSRHH